MTYQSEQGLVTFSLLMEPSLWLYSSSSTQASRRENATNAVLVVATEA